MKKQNNFFLKLFVVVIAIFMVISMLFTIDETALGVVTRFGRPLENVRKPGLNIKFPWPIDRVIRIDNRVLLLKFPTQNWLTYDQNEVVVDAFLLWKIVDPILFSETVQDIPTAENRLSDIVLARLGISIGAMPFNAFVNLEENNIQVHKILTDDLEKVNAVVKEFGLNVTDIGLETFLVPQQNRTSIINRMNADRNRVATLYRYTGIKEALEIEGEALSDHTKILGKAHAESTAIRGKGEAEALEILAKAYNQDPQFYSFIRSLESYEAIIGKQSTIFLEADSPLLKYFNGASINTTLQSHESSEKK